MPWLEEDLAAVVVIALVAVEDVLKIKPGYRRHEHIGWLGPMRQVPEAVVAGTVSVGGRIVADDRCQVAQPKRRVSHRSPPDWILWTTEKDEQPFGAPQRFVGRQLNDLGLPLVLVQARTANLQVGALHAPWANIVARSVSPQASVCRGHWGAGHCAGLSGLEQAKRTAVCSQTARPHVGAAIPASACTPGNAFPRGLRPSSPLPP
jgi:hypothetical protein